MSEQRPVPAPRRRRVVVLLVSIVAAVIALLAGVAIASPQLLGPVGAPSPSDLPTPTVTSSVTPSSPTATPATPLPTSTPASPTPSASPTATAKPSPPADGVFELPLTGATGFVTVKTALKPVAGRQAGTLKPGQRFTIEADEGEAWIVSSGSIGGRLASDDVMLNLPDVIPSIVYDDVNGDAAIFTSSGVDLPGVTGKRLYVSKAFNSRLQVPEYSMAVLYPMARKIQAAQRAALANGETLILYQAFRPHATQKKVSLALIGLHKENKKVRSGIDNSGWGISSFIALNLSSHQLGTAIDVSLGKVTGTRTMQGRDYSYTEADATEYEMQTRMHELSTASSTYTHPVRTKTGSAWKKAPLNPAMTKAAKRLQRYAVAAGLTPLASEWWHFDDWDARKHVAAGSNGRYFLQLPK